MGIRLVICLNLLELILELQLYDFTFDDILETLFLLSGLPPALCDYPCPKFLLGLTLTIDFCSFNLCVRVGAMFL